MTKGKRSDELDAALRADPDYQELRALLSKQTARQKARLEAALSQTCEGSQGREDTMEKDANSRIRDLKEADGKTYAEITEILKQEGYKDKTGNPFKKKAVQNRYLHMKKKETSQPSQPGEPSGPESVPCEPGEPCENILPGSHESQSSQVSQLGEPCETGSSDLADSQYSQLCEQSTETDAPCETCDTCDTPMSDSLDSHLSQPGEPFTETDESCETSEPCEPREPSQEIPSQWLAPLRNLIREEIQSAMIAKHAHVAKTDMDKPPRRPKKEGSREHSGDKVTLGGTRIDQVLFDAFHAERQEAGISASELVERILWHRYGRPKLSFQVD